MTRAALALLLTQTDKGPSASQSITYRYRLLPNSAQHAKLHSALEHTRDLYNAAIQERADAYRKARARISLFDQTASLTNLRRDDEWSIYSVSLQRWPLRQVDLAFKSFFRRIAEGRSKVGYPRFKGRSCFKTFGFSDRTGWSLERSKIKMKGLGALRVKIHRPLPSSPTTLKIKRFGKRWFALLTVEVENAEQHTFERSVGLDVGVSHLATLSTGQHIANARHKARLSGRIRRAQRALARCRRGSNNRAKAKARVAALKLREVNARVTYLHQVSAKLTRCFGTIVVEKLALGNMARSAKGTVEAPGVNVKAKAGLNRSLHDAAFGRLKEMLRYKAERAGGRLIEVDPRHTSQTCSSCGVIDARSRCSQSRFACTGCGFELNADWNAAINIARLGGVAVPGTLDLGVAQDVCGKIGIGRYATPAPADEKNSDFHVKQRV